MNVMQKKAGTGTGTGIGIGVGYNGKQQACDCFNGLDAIKNVCMRLKNVCTHHTASCRVHTRSIASYHI